MKSFAMVFGVLALVLTFSVGEAVALGNQEQGRRLVEEHGCLSCHGDAARRDMTGVPILDGQKTGFLIRTLLHFKQEEVRAAPGSEEIIVQRRHPLMNDLAGDMTVQDVKDIATYFARRTCVSAGDPMAVTEPPKGVERCEICHGGVRSNPWADTPFLAGQDRTYLLTQIRRLWDGAQAYDESSARHHRLAEIMFADADDSRLEAYADYYAALPCAR
jgi:cytochrome c553